MHFLMVNIIKDFLHFPSTGETSINNCDFNTGIPWASALIARSPEALKEIFHKLQNETTLVGLSINEDKTKYTQIKRT
jgi:hypothetical protein